MVVSSQLSENKKLFRQILPAEKSFDIIERDINIGGIDATLYFIDGFLKDEVMEKVVTNLRCV